jgi:tight adherence protein B
MTTQAPSAAWWPTVLVVGALFASVVLARRALASSRADGLVEALGQAGVGSLRRSGPPFIGRLLLAGRQRLAWNSVALGATLGWFGFRLLGVGGLVAGAGIGVASPSFLAAGRRRRERELLERQVAEVAESAALAVRSGLSIRQALQFTAIEVADPMKSAMTELVRDKALGTPLDQALNRWVRVIGTGEARLLALVITIHARSGGDLAGALDEVAGTIRHRVAVRRELSAMTAQGRSSGTILGALPIAFFIVLAATSRSDLVPVYRSAPGLAMLGTGLVLELLAYLWIRRLIRVEV